jgi:copper transport protein
MTLRRLWRSAALAGLVGLWLAGPAAAPAAAHAQLISSTPGAGELLAESPAELRLAFSEPLDPSFLDVDLLDQDGGTLAPDIGRVDPADDHALVAPMPPLADGLYTVNWRVLSAADGHVTQGFFTFGVGDVEVPGTSGGGGGAGDLHAGQSPLVAVLDAASRAATYGGTLLAFGLPLIAWLVIAPATGRIPSRILGFAAGALGLAAVGTIGQLAVGVSTLDLGAAGLLTYAIDSRSGLLLSARLVVALVGAGLVLLLASRRGPRSAAIAGGAAGAVGIGLVALGGHAAATTGAGPVVADAAHLGAAGTWMSGLAGLVALASGWLGRLPNDAMRSAVPRFSALALVSIGLVALTGLYASWLQVGDPRQLGTPYGWALIGKVAVVLTALSIGAVNYVDGGRNLRLGGGLRRRVAVELGLAAVVIVVTANLTSGIPPAQVPTVRVPIASGEPGFELAFQPGRPGPNRAVVMAPPPGLHLGTVELQLDRLDTAAGSNRIPLRQDPSAPHGYGFLADGVLLPDGSRWTASAVVRDADGVEVSRTRFTFALGTDAIQVDRGLVLGPGLVLGALLGLAGVSAIGYWLGGGTLPRADRDLGRRALAVGGAVAITVGVAVIAVAPG